MIIRHKRFMDVCFYVSDCKFDFLYIEGYWINMGYVKSWFIDKQLVYGTVENKADWEVCTGPDLPCLRYQTWEPL